MQVMPVYITSLDVATINLITSIGDNTTLDLSHMNCLIMKNDPKAISLFLGEDSYQGILFEHQNMFKYKITSRGKIMFSTINKNKCLSSEVISNIIAIKKKISNNV